MGIKVEVIIVCTEEVAKATTTIYGHDDGFTVQEMAIAQHIKRSAEKLFDTEQTVINNEGNNNVH